MQALKTKSDATIGWENNITPVIVRTTLKYEWMCVITNDFICNSLKPREYISIWSISTGPFESESVMTMRRPGWVQDYYQLQHWWSHNDNKVGESGKFERTYLMSLVDMVNFTRNWLMLRKRMTTDMVENINNSVWMSEKVYNYFIAVYGSGLRVRYHRYQPNTPKEAK